MPFKEDIRSVTVPGCVDGWLSLHERFGRLGLDRVLAPAIGYARDGFPASTMLAASIPVLPPRPGSEDLRGPTGSRTPGEVIRRSGVARALDAIVSDGRAGFYEGEFGEGLLKLGNGEYAAADLASPGARWVDPISVEAFGHILWGIPPSSQGYLLLSSAWIADGLPLPDDPDDPLWAHLLIEASKQAGHDRPAVLHDAADGRALVSTERLAPRREAITVDRASHLGVGARVGDTTALCVVDGDGVGVSLIQSNASGFGSHLFEPSTGINLHNRGLGFSVEEGHPAEYAPGRQPPHTLTPAMVTDLDGRLAAVLGTMGGDSQPQILLQILARTFGLGESPSRAIAAGRFRLSAKEQTTGFAIWTDRAGTAVALEGHAPPRGRAGSLPAGTTSPPRPRSTTASGTPTSSSSRTDTSPVPPTRAPARVSAPGCSGATVAPQWASSWLGRQPQRAGRSTCASTQVASPRSARSTGSPTTRCTTSPDTSCSRHRPNPMRTSTRR